MNFLGYYFTTSIYPNIHPTYNYVMGILYLFLFYLIIFNSVTDPASIKYTKCAS